MKVLKLRLELHGLQAVQLRGTPAMSPTLLRGTLTDYSTSQVDLTHDCQRGLLCPAEHMLPKGLHLAQEGFHHRDKGHKASIET